MLLKLHYNKNLEGKFTENGLFVLNYVNGFEMNYFVMCSLRDPEFQYFASCLQASTLPGILGLIWWVMALILW